MNAQQLKNAILQEAIEGRLVPQDPNDEPASVLLERIRKEKEKLVKEGKLKKKDLEEKPISDEDIPFEIPKSWEWVRLKPLVSVLGDGIHGTPEYDITGDYYFINGNNLSNNKIVIKADTKKVNEKEYQIHKKELNDKTILVSINGTIGNVGHYNGEPVILGKSACYYNLMDLSLKSYITMLMYTDYFLKYAVENATGSTIKNVSLAVMNDFLVPLPPLAEQHRIVAKIEELLPKVEEYGKAQDALNKLNAELPERLKKSILQEAIEGRLVPQDPNDEPASVLLDKIRKEKERLVKAGKLKKKDLEVEHIFEDEIPFEIPETWEWARLSNVVNIIMGQSPDGDDVYESEYDDNAFEFHQGKICFTERFISPSGKWCKNPSRIAEKGSLLVCVRAPIGDVNITQRIISIGRGLASITGYCGIQTLFLFFWLMAHKRVLEDKGTGSTFKAITIEVLKNQPIPLPPLAEQHRIVEKLEQVLGEIDKLKK